MKKSWNKKTKQLKNLDDFQLEKQALPQSKKSKPNLKISTNKKQKEINKNGTKINLTILKKSPIH